jgi:hypothetical protein
MFLNKGVIIYVEISNRVLFSVVGRNGIDL